MYNLFPLISSLITLLMVLFIYKTIAKMTVKFRKFTGVFLSIICLFCIAYLATIRLGVIDGLFYKICVFSFAFLAIAFFVSILYNILNFIGQKVPFEPKRRKTLKVIFDISFIIFTVSLFFKGTFNALTPKLTTKTIKIKNLKEPINFAVISDIHLGKFLGAKFLDKIVDKINSLNYDALL
ncbi:MAG: hypothetical protein MR902_00225, partial [Campylobacter sp.]|nr:hypothetical protein [Campylobacter sp.]